ncbi:hypothetical protein [Halogeometricum luteum]|uniref:Uncharacterized protein n=1 Tax=Halogeometricum luteum TaxID=2950537 RepID=A0ABU2FZ29_9EURY|nr:hypothetical protein [Halogeometricum sp. S3BR5-2]MDS0293481.1 hypothetical protein [Halogeometricum sp. S3BR5-2]
MLETLREHIFPVTFVLYGAIAVLNYLDGDIFMTVGWGVAAAIAASLVWYTYLYDEPGEERAEETESEEGAGSN